LPASLLCYHCFPHNYSLTLRFPTSHSPRPPSSNNFAFRFLFCRLVLAPNAKPAPAASGPYRQRRDGPMRRREIRIEGERVHWWWWSPKLRPVYRLRNCPVYLPATYCVLHSSIPSIPSISSIPSIVVVPPSTSHNL